MRLLLPFLVVAAGCSSLERGTLNRQVGSSFQRLGDRIKAGVDPPSRLALLDQRPMLIDFRNAIRRLPSTLRLEAVPFADHHTSVRMAATGATDWQQSGPLSRALVKFFP